MAREQKWPDTIWLVRHGESAGNVAQCAAEAAGHATVDMHVRDVDIPLSDLGMRQAQTLGQWFAQMPPADRPNVVLSSPYLRARSTADLIVEAGGTHICDDEMVTDERLREREFGILDQLTKVGVALKFPEQAQMKEALGKFYHRPPGGESWCDVILRLRSLVNTITRDYRQQRLLIVCHSVVVLCFRYLFERMTEDQILEIDRELDVANCSVTTYEFDPTIGSSGRLALRGFNFVSPLELSGTTVTNNRDIPGGPK